MFILSTLMIELSNSFQYEFEQHMTKQYGYSAINLTPASSGSTTPRTAGLARSRVAGDTHAFKAASAPKGPLGPNIEQVKNPNGPNREFEYLEGRVSKVENDVRDLRHTGNSPTLAPKPERKPKNSPARPTQKRSRRKTSGKMPIKKLKDRARRRWERKHPGWPEIKKELEERGVTVAEKDGKLSLKGGS